MPNFIGTSYRRGATFDDASNRLFGAMLSGGGQLSDARRSIIDLTIRRLKDQGIWDKLDCLYMFAALDSASALINWKNPGTFNATLTNAPSFVADRGFTGNGTTSYVNTNFNPSTAGGRYTQDSAHLAYRDLTSATSGADVVSNAAKAGLRARTAANAIGTRINQTTESASTETFAGDSTGLYHSTRDSSSTSQLYRNGVALTITPQASIALANATFTAGYNGVSSFNTHQIASMCMGGALSAGEVSSFVAAERAYMQSVGAV